MRLTELVVLTLLDPGIMRRHWMDIILAGLNIDRTILGDVIRLLNLSAKQLSEPETKPEDNDQLTGEIRRLLDSDCMTPETLSAAYARISRDPRPVNQLREDARLQVGKARRSNRSIIFGMGHASVAEHAVFNFDVLGVSRYLSEIIQSHRLCSFTEKSQRYIHLDQDYMIPDELKGSPIADEFENFVQQRFEDYRELTRLIELDPKHDSALTAEDARYILPLSVTSQMGMTINARCLEKLLQQAASSPLSEFREFGTRMYGVVDGVAPSLIKYTQASTRQADMDQLLMKCPTPFHDCASGTGKPADDIRLLHVTPDGDTRVARALISRLRGISWECLDPDSNKEQNAWVEPFFLEIFRHMDPWDSAPREFEYVDYLFEIVLSAAAFAQLKRHRMATLVSGLYDPTLGVTIPPILKGTAGEQVLLKAVEASGKLAESIESIAQELVPYAFLACHRRRVLMKINARELIHLSRLREDEHAQWDIRSIATRMVTLAREVTPGCMLPACGKHAFQERQRQFEL